MSEAVLMTRKPGTKNWRDVLKVHPACELFPRLSEKEAAELRESIKKIGIQTPVIIIRDMNAQAWLIDGRERLDAMEALGRPTFDEKGRSKFPVEDFLEVAGITSYNPAAMVMAANIHRRHLTAEQRADLAIKVLTAAKAFASEQAQKIRAEDERKEADEITGKHFPVIGEQHNPPKQKGKRGSVKGDVAKVAEMAGVSKPTARKAIREARGEESKPRTKMSPPVKKPENPDAYNTALRIVEKELDREGLLNLRDAINDRLSAMKETASRTRANAMPKRFLAGIGTGPKKKRP
jgi:NACalpha-BTF3-like transcription factor